MFIEPNADMRSMASMLWQAYNAFLNEGFTEEQSIRLTCQIIATGMNSNRKDNE